MTHRTQITLEDEQYARLSAESAETGLSLAELVRRALDSAYPRMTTAERRAALDASFGAWSEDPERDEALADLRPGLGEKLDTM